MRLKSFLRDLRVGTYAWLRHAAMVAGQVPDDSSRHELDALWRATQERLQASVPDSTFRLWLQPLQAVGADAETLYLTAPEGIRAWAERRYSALIERSAGATAGTRPAAGRFAPTEGAVAAVRRASWRRAEPQLHLRPLRHRRAATASPTAPPWPSPRPRRRPTTRSSSTAPRGSARPTCWRRSPTTCGTNAPGLSVRYTTAESFTNEFVGALKSAGAEAFKAPLPRPRRAADRRRPVPRGQAGHRGGVLPHLQRPL